MFKLIFGEYLKEKNIFSKKVNVLEKRFKHMFDHFK